MRNSILIFLLLTFGVFTGCGSGPASEGETPAEEAADTSAQTRGMLREGTATLPCPVTDQMLEGNWLLIRGQNLLLTITADSTTYDANLGPSHRVLQVYDSETCRRIDRQVLPVNLSPDFAYQIAEINYNNESQLVAIKGFDVMYVYDVAIRRLLPPLKARFKSERVAIDAQSGLIQRLEIWEHYLVGYAQDFGAFVFDLKDKSAPRAVLPFAEWKEPENDYHTLFLLPSGQRIQVLLPVYRREAADFAINPLFPEPQLIDQGGSETLGANRYVVLRLQGATPSAVVVDLQKRERLMLPANLTSAGNRQIEEWLKTRER